MMSITQRKQINNQSNMSLSLCLCLSVSLKNILPSLSKPQPKQPTTITMFLNNAILLLEGTTVVELPPRPLSPQLHRVLPGRTTKRTLKRTLKRALKTTHPAMKFVCSTTKKYYTHGRCPGTCCRCTVTPCYTCYCQTERKATSCSS